MKESIIEKLKSLLEAKVDDEYKQAIIYSNIKG